MKYIVVLVFIFMNIHADEIQRIESIVNDIEKLRTKYEVSQDELIIKQQNEIKQNEKIRILENQIIVYKKQLKIKQKKVYHPKPKKKIKICKPAKAKAKIIYKIKKLENPNKFPRLMLKPEYVKYIKKNMKAKTYRLKTKTDIYDGINGKKIQTWKSATAFTSNLKAEYPKLDSWVKITGYFIKNSWVPTRGPMWVKQKYIK